MKLVFASDSFKGTLTQDQINQILEETAAETLPEWDTVSVPVADGGEGTVAAVVKATGGTLRQIPVHGPQMEPVTAGYGILPDGSAVIEMAAACGLTLVPEAERNPLHTTTFGFGELIADALLQGCKVISLAVGGSATNDGGMGALRALGWQFWDKDQKALPGFGRDLSDVMHISYVDTENLSSQGQWNLPASFSFKEAIAKTRFVILCDVSNPLLGPTGATRVFGPQKGADEATVETLEAGMTHFADVCGTYLGKNLTALPGGGAAGGLGAALYGFLNGSMQSGISTVLDLCHFSDTLQDADYCLTGEGRLDSQSLHGKVISGVLDRCKKQKVPCAAIVGCLGQGYEAVLQAGLEAAYPTDAFAKDNADALQNAEKYYRMQAASVMESLPLRLPTKVVDGWFTVTHNATELALGKKALLVTGRHSAVASGALDDVLGALKKQKIDYVLFDQTEENPSRETVMRATEVGLKAGADFVIGIGGGSPLDAAKAIALMMKHPDWGMERLYEPPCSPDNKNEALPLVAIPTTCGTGSEVTGVSVLTRHDLQTKGSIPYKIYPNVALLDPLYLLMADREMIVHTAVDALAHMYESFLHADATDYSRRFVLKGLSYWSRSKGILDKSKEPETEDYRNLLLASMYAGLAIAQTGTALPHAISYELTYHAGIPHGVACGWFLPRYLQLSAEKGFSKEAETLLSAGGFSSLTDFAAFVHTTCGPISVSKELLKQDLKHLSKNTEKLRTAPFPVSLEELSAFSKEPV